MRVRILTAAVLMVALGAASWADDKPLDRTDLDRRAVNAVYQTALLGTEIFNKGKHEECYRLYQGALMSLQPMLDHRPKLAASVKVKMDKAHGMSAAEGAFVLRDALDEIQYDIAPVAKAKVEPKADPKVEPKKMTTLWDRLGGEVGVKKVVDELIAEAIEDKEVNLTRGKVLKKEAMDALKQNIVAMIREVTGGPLPKYEGKDMRTAHAGMKITEKEFDAFAAHLVSVLKKHKVAQADIDDLMKIIGRTKKDIVEGKGN